MHEDVGTGDMVPHHDMDHIARSQGLDAALITASYAPDLERCRLLCDTIDARVSNLSHHYILVSHKDAALFRQLAGPKRSIVDERDILPSWLHDFADPMSLFKRRIWLSRHTKPLRGWHVQQMRRIAIAAHLPEQALYYVDSDVAFVHDFDCHSTYRDGLLPLFRRDDAMEKEPAAKIVEQLIWLKNAGSALGLKSQTSPHDYIGTLIAWRREQVVAMCKRIEDQHGSHWVSVLGRQRKFSECMLYGRFIDEVAGQADHYISDTELCHVCWWGPKMDPDGLRQFIATMRPEQVAIGIQSFIGTEIADMRRVLL